MTSRTTPTPTYDLDAPQGMPIAVVAFGGNALIRQGERGSLDEQVKNAESAVAPLCHLLERGYRLLLVHGNGPQVGHELIRQEESSAKIPPLPLDVCVANTQGAMGYLLERAYRNLRASGLVTPEIATVLTQVEVDNGDPAFRNPTKPVGPFLSEDRAQELRRDAGKTVAEDAGRGWRVVVPSPRPRRVLGIEATAALLDRGFVVIAGGGGGIPVHIANHHRYAGLEAVIDKDHTASLMGRILGANTLIILTAVPRVSVHFNTPQQRDLDLVTVDELKHFDREGHFPAGSMGPKIRAAIDFLEGGGHTCIITCAERLGETLAGSDGTRIVSHRPSNA